MKCLKEYNTVKEFMEFVEDLNITKWYVYPGSTQDRMKLVINKEYFLKLKTLASQNEINAADEEIISWIDTLNQMYYAFKKIENKYNDINIIQEFKIPFTNNRIDYLLCKDNRILIIEFSLYNGEDSSNRSKFIQAQEYKEKLSNLLPPHIKIGTFVYLYKIETNSYETITKISEYTRKEEIENTDTQMKLSEYLKYYFYTTNIDAYNEILRTSFIIDAHHQSLIKACQ